jgi:ABC-type glycerol-3-phosphate transport system permease component
MRSRTGTGCDPISSCPSRFIELFPNYAGINKEQGRVSALHPAAYATSFNLSATPWTLENFARAWSQAPFGRNYFNTIVLVVLIPIGQLVLSTWAAYAFARFKFRGSGIAFALVCCN